MLNLRLRNATQSGFTLTEVVIVMGIIGTVLSSIWTAAHIAYTQRTATDLVHEIVYFAQNARTQFSSMQVALGNNIQDNTDNDSCSSALPCSTTLMMQSGTFESDLLNPSNTISGANYDGATAMYVTKYGFPIWTGIENSDLYAQQDGICGVTGQPACNPGTTIIELDLFGLSVPICSYLLIQLANAKIDGLIGLAAPSNGWGSMLAGNYYGSSQSSVPSNMTLDVANEACTPPGTSAFNYITTNQSYIWLFFANS